MGGCQNYGPFLGTLNIRGRIIIGTQKGTMILTTTHMEGGGRCADTRISVLSLFWSASKLSFARAGHMSHCLNWGLGV